MRPIYSRDMALLRAWLLNKDHPRQDEVKQSIGQSQKLIRTRRGSRAVAMTHKSGYTASRIRCCSILVPSKKFTDAIQTHEWYCIYPTTHTHPICTKPRHITRWVHVPRWYAQSRLPMPLYRVGLCSNLARKGLGRMNCRGVTWGQVRPWSHKSLRAKGVHSATKKFSLNCYHQRTEGNNDHHTCEYWQRMRGWCL